MTVRYSVKLVTEFMRTFDEIVRSKMFHNSPKVIFLHESYQLVNTLLQCVVKALSTNAFKNGLDKHWTKMSARKLRLTCPSTASTSYGTETLWCLVLKCRMVSLNFFLTHIPQVCGHQRNRFKIWWRCVWCRCAFIVCSVNRETVSEP